MPSYEYVNGRMVEVPDTVIDKSCELNEPVTRTLVIRPGVRVVSHAEITGTVRVGSGSVLEARNDVSGTISVESGAQATFHKKAGGTLSVARGGSATLLPTAIALGTMNIAGTLVNQGTRGINIKGTGIVEDSEGSTVRHPDETWPDGTMVYRS